MLDTEYVALVNSDCVLRPDTLRRYATDDVEEVAALSRMLGGASYALAQMVPRRYERLAETGVTLISPFVGGDGSDRPTPGARVPALRNGTPRAPGE